jgi:hypothetical protein
MSISRKFRRAADVFITELRSEIDNLNTNAPEFPVW